MVVCSSCMASFEDCTCGFYQKIELDDNIADIVMLLNHKGYQTRFSCEGHTEQVCEPGAIGTYVLFEKPYFKGAASPEGFQNRTLNGQSDMEYIRSPRKKTKTQNAIPNETIKAELLQALRRWAEALPDGPDKPPYKTGWISEKQKIITLVAAHRLPLSALDVLPDHVQRSLTWNEDHSWIE